MDDTRLWDRISRKSDAECWPWQGSTVRGHGYLSVKNKTRYAHRLVWEETRGQKLQRSAWVQRTCGNNRCCNPRHMKVKANRGSGHPNSKLTEGDVSRIHNLWMTGQTVAEIANQFDVSKTTINKVINRRTWKHVVNV